MQKPSDFDEAREYGESKPLEPGGHILKILKVEETRSRNGAEMIIIYFDTDKSDKQPGYYKQRYDSDTRKDKSWGGRIWQLVHDQTEDDTNPAFKTFITSVTKSNSSSFHLTWGEKFCECFKNRLVGGVFRREQYVTSKGNIAFAVKCCGFRSVVAINEGVEVPEDKLLPEGEHSQPAKRDSVVVDASDDDDYPF